ncbi:gluconolactonase [Xanthomonas arboricola]|uniref:Gluconolactonase n=1 Tax=Xanthomonas cannabis pv. phaseoli TaxID=1885902 RepID=A0AB34PD26_9XANT|nr:MULTISPECIES: SMP-30/gluconolactonase/LRE family protein [Xanthomonas]KGK58823.1 gluconolactonase [Xanthomonas cannabis pv. phaseoli]MBB3803507.1 gluconolactonase [Xanthomonas cannabis]MBB3807860.1 gluconolactonase [Xanthomonas cannabis]PPU28272.1 gluconolactonase [Xanthomonas sp. CFBP 7912]RJS01761.1 SMP-30/gluconolactonase/LRE family protein [Xanthomonas sp. CFBP 7698]
MRLPPYLLLAVPLLAIVAACARKDPPPPRFPAIGHVDTFDRSFADVVASDARIEKLTEGFTWSEGPAWVRDGGYLLFTDVPENKLYRWSEQAGLSVLLSPSGYTGPEQATLREAGANGLYAEPSGTVLLADSGTRIVARLDPVTRKKTPLATRFEGKRFNSPNDVVRRSDGVVFFTDPPYGLKDLNNSPVKQLRFNGVYRLDTDGSVHLLDDSLSFPNGIALSPDERTLYVSNSDPERPIWMAYALDTQGAVTGKRVFADASDLVAKDAPGLPDGMAVSADGHLFATGPGGVIVFNPAGQRLGRIETGEAVSNCAFGNDGHTLYMTSHAMLARVRVKALGLQFAK